MPGVDGVQGSKGNIVSLVEVGDGGRQQRPDRDVFACLS